MRGKEAESNLDWELTEDENAGNPPAFMFVLNYLLQKAQSENDDRIIHTMINLRPRVALWFSYFNTRLANQAPNLVGTFMWMDNVPAGSLSSGIDDYPRGFRDA